MIVPYRGRSVQSYRLLMTMSSSGADRRVDGKPTDLRVLGKYLVCESAHTRVNTFIPAPPSEAILCRVTADSHREES